MKAESPDEALARLAANHSNPAASEAAFALLVELYSPRLLAFVSSLSFKGADVEDILQEIWLRVWRALPNWRDEHFRGWLFEIARNYVNDVNEAMARRAKRREHIALDTVATRAASPEEVASSNELEMRLRTCLKELSAEQREVIQGHTQGETYENMATRFRRPLNTVKTQLFRAREQLAKCLQLNNP